MLNQLKKGVALLVKPFTTYIWQNKDIQLIRYQASYVFTSNFLFLKKESKNLRSFISKTPVNSNNFLTPESSKYTSSTVVEKVKILQAMT